MTSRFRSNWAKEGPKSTSPTFDPPARSDPVPVDFGVEYRGDYCRVDSEGKRRNGSRSARDTSSTDRNGKSRDINGIAGSCYGEERELDNESESPEVNYHRRHRPDFRCRSAEVEESARERRPLSGKKGAIGVAPTSTTRDLVEDEADDMEAPETILPASAMTNGESSVGIAGNGSAKQVRRSAERRGAPSSSLTRERIVDLSTAIHRTADVTNRSTICTIEKSNGNGRERSSRRFSRSEDIDKPCETGAAGRVNETDDFGSIDRGRSRRARDRSHSPIEDVATGNGNSSRGRETGEKFNSPARRVFQDFGSIDRGKSLRAKDRSHSPIENVATGNGDSSRGRETGEKFQSPARRPPQDFGSIDRGRSRRAKDRSHSPIEDVATGNGNSSRGRETGEKFRSPARRPAQDFGSIDRGRSRRARDHSHSPIDDVATGNGDSIRGRETGEKFHSPARRVAQDFGSIDRRRSRRARDRSHSPIEDVANGNGNSSRGREIGEKFHSPARRPAQDFGSMDRGSRRRARGRSHSPEEEGDATTNGNFGPPATRSGRGKPPKDEEFGSMTGRSNMAPFGERAVFADNGNDSGFSRSAVETNGNRGENGNGKKYSEIGNDDHSLRKESSKRKSHTNHKASPEDFDVQIHRYERALRAPRRDSDLTKKGSFRDYDSSLSRRNSIEDRHRLRDLQGRRSSHKRRDAEVAGGSSEDRDHEQVSRKSSFRNRDGSSTRKSSLTNRNLSDIGAIINDNNRNNGSHHRDHSGSSRRDRDPSIAGDRRRSSRANVNEEEDQDGSSWRNDRHSRPLTPPTSLEDVVAHDDSRDRRSIAVSSSSKHRYATNEDEFAHKCALDRNDCRGKAHEGTDVTQERDRFSSSTRRVVSSRSFNESRKDGSARISRIDAGNKISTRDPTVDHNDLRDDARNSDFSTIERNGTTVIRIRTNSESPVGHLEPRSRRRTSHQEAGAGRYRRYEDEAEDEDEDDETFERDNQRRADSSWRNYKAGQRRLWSNRDGSVQITDLDDGQPCLHCGETCPGFSPHTWRKNCTSCKCPREAHDVCHEEWVSVRARLGLKGEGPNNHVGFDPRDRGLTWAPPGLPPSKVEEYYAMLPEISVPRIGTPGERHRDRQLATQLPKQDLARAYCRHLDSQHSASADDFMAARNEIALDIGSVKEILERGHECGVCHEPLKYGSLVVSASKLGLSYHPSCFQCTQCRELLVDLAYCVHDDALYCERHYAEQLKPRCAACDELIFSGEYTKAMNKDWHSGHFCCWQCDESLTGQRYVLRDEHPYCIKCYESVFANGCEECSKIIGIDSKDLSYKDKHWHEACFLCNKCRVSLVDKQFGSKVDKIYCGNCYDAQFASRCDGCGEIFRAGTKKMEYKTRQWHEKCFCCVVCKAPIGTKSFIPREQEIYCAGCYEDKFATRCVKCNKIITSGGVTYKNEPWHRDCFTCSNCNNSLAGQRFTSRDEKPYCAECFGELFAKRCTACTKPITGIGGTRFISFEDRHWHNNCFICAGCNTSLVGRGFITDGDDIICPECAKQKLSE